MDVLRLVGWVELHVAHYPPAGDYVVETRSSPHRRLEILYMFRGFAIPPEDGLQAAAAGGLRAAPPEVLNASNYDKKAKTLHQERTEGRHFPSGDCFYYCISVSRGGLKAMLRAMLTA
jgi:hypothetical protein